MSALVVLLPISAALVGATAYLVVSMAAPRTRVGRWLALWIAVWAEIVLTVEVLSLFDAITPVWFVVCYVAFAAIALAVWFKRGKPRARLITLPYRWQIAETARKHPVLAVLLVVLGLCALVNLLLAVGLPVNNHDAMSYHLSRVGYWIQRASTDHFFTHNERQNFAPPNAEFGYLSTMIFARAEWPAPLAQYAAYFVCLAAVYLLARLTGASDAAALFAALLLGTMTEIVLQSTIPKNGLIVSSFLVCSAAFALVGLRRPPKQEPADEKKEKKRRKRKRRARPVRERETVTTDTRVRALVWSALALGLAVGTKITALAFLPGLAIAGVTVAVAGGAKDWLKRTALWAGCCIAALVLLGAFNYARNYADYAGSIGGPAKTAKSVRLEHTTARAVVSNLARYGYHLCDFSGLLPRSVARGLTHIRAAAAPGLFAALHIPVNAPETNLGGSQDQFRVDKETGRFDSYPRLHEDQAWYGPIAFFVGLPLVLVHLVYSPLRRQWPRFAVALLPALYWLIVCATLRYQVWGGRFFVTAAVAAAPLLSLAYVPRSPRALRHTIRWLLLVVGISTLCTATFYNTAKPIVPRPAADDIEVPPDAKIRGVLKLPRAKLQCRYYNPKGSLIVGLPPDVFPERMTLGVVLEGDDCDWLLFGPHLGRRLVPLPADSARVREAFVDGEVDMVLLSELRAEREKMPPIIGERSFIVPLNPRQRLDRMLTGVWSFIFRRKGDENLLFPTRDWFLLEQGWWLTADQRFVPTRELPAGRIVVSIEPYGPMLQDGPLVFHFYAGDIKVHEETVETPEKTQFFVPWQPGPGARNQILRVVVTSPNASVEEGLRRGAVAYELLHPPIFMPLHDQQGEPPL